MYDYICKNLVILDFIIFCVVFWSKGNIIYSNIWIVLVIFCGFKDDGEVLSIF